MQIRKSAFPPNETHLVQPVDSFVIQNLKDAWNSRWDAMKMSSTTKDELSKSSAKILDPGKDFFLNLAAAFERDVNGMRDESGLSFARKAMVRCGIALHFVVHWHRRPFS